MGFDVRILMSGTFCSWHPSCIYSDWEEKQEDAAMEPNFKKRRKIACITSAILLIVLVSYSRCSNRETAPHAYQKATIERTQTSLVDAEGQNPLPKVGL
jgi:hypothetical protein